MEIKLEVVAAFLGAICTFILGWRNIILTAKRNHNETKLAEERQREETRLAEERQRVVALVETNEVLAAENRRVREQNEALNNRIVETEHKVKDLTDKLDRATKRILELEHAVISFKEQLAIDRELFAKMNARLEKLSKGSGV